MFKRGFNQLIVTSVVILAYAYWQNTKITIEMSIISNVINCKYLYDSYQQFRYPYQKFKESFSHDDGHGNLSFRYNLS